MTLLHTGQFQIGVCSIIEKNELASKHCMCVQAVERVGTDMRMKVNYIRPLAVHS